MRILHLIHQYPPDYIGGAELYTQQLASELADRGVTNDIFFRRDGVKPALEHWRERERVHVWAATSKQVTANRRFFASFYEPTLESFFTEAATQIKPDLIHAQHLLGLPASTLSRSKIPFLITLHDYWFLCANAQLVTNYSQELCKGPKAWINCGQCALSRAGFSQLAWLSPAFAPLLANRERILRAVLSRAKLIVSPSEMVASVPRRLGMPASKIKIIRHGFRIPPYVKRKTRPPGNGFHIGYVGGLAWQKGAHVLIKAMNGLPSENIRLTIIGDPSAFPDYAQSLRELATHPNIMFAGKLTHEQVWRKFADLDVLVMPSLWFENAPQVIQEALATGTPVIASDVGALPESVQDGINGRLFPPGNAEALRDILVELWRDEGILQKLIAGIAPIRTIAQHVDDVLALYVKLTTNSRAKIGFG